MSSSNLDKNKHGLVSRDTLRNLLDLSKQLGYISSFTDKYRVGKEGYKNTSQFHPPFLITFSDGTQWIFFTTTTIRERVKASYWDTLNLKALNPKITRSYLVYPDSINPEEKKKAERKNARIIAYYEYSTLDGIISQDKVFNYIEEYALRGKSDGQVRDIQGNNFEARIAATLENPWNLKKWKTGDLNLEGMHYDIFESIVECFGLNRNTVSSISATSDKSEIGLLPSGGPAKTDVLVHVYTTDNPEGDIYTISCKRSHGSSVSVHQYNADTFSRVLDPSNKELKELLTLFQRCGNMRDMGTEKVKRLTELLSPYIDTLSLWALGGNGGDGDMQTQWARYIITYDNNTGTTTIHKITDYCNLLRQKNTRGSFGTPFSWTFQGQRGTNIQLKCRIIK